MVLFQSYHGNRDLPRKVWPAGPFETAPELGDTDASPSSVDGFGRLW